MQKMMNISSALLIAAVIMLSATSCTKDYECECSQGGDSYVYDLKDVKKKDADDACDLAGEVWIETGGSCTATEVE